MILQVSGVKIDVNSDSFLSEAVIVCMSKYSGYRSDKKPDWWYVISVISVILVVVFLTAKSSLFHWPWDLWRGGKGRWRHFLSPIIEAGDTY